jgi:hypothetical protein
MDKKEFNEEDLPEFPMADVQKMLKFPHPPVHIAEEGDGIEVGPEEKMF